MRSRRILGLVPLLLAGAVFGSCDSSDPKSDSAQGEVTSTTAVTTTTAARTGFDYARPGVEAMKVEDAAGDLEGITPDGRAFIVSLADKRYTKNTCEGGAQNVLQLDPLEFGKPNRTLLNGTAPYYGDVLRASNGRVAIIERCEEFLGTIVVADQAADGGLTNSRTVRTDGLPETPAALKWAWDASSLVGVSYGDSQDPQGNAGWTLDPTSSKVTERYRGHMDSFGLMADGNFVVDDGAASDQVFIRDANGSKATGGGGIFQISPDGTRVATYGLDDHRLRILTIAAYDMVAEVSQAEVISDVVWAPTGDALAFITQPDKTDAPVKNNVYVVDIPSRKLTSITGGDRYEALHFSPDGEILAWNRWSARADAANDIMWLRFPRF